MIARAGSGDKVVDTEFPIEDKFDVLAAPKRDAIAKRGISAFVTVQEGCDKFCTFCVVPYTRGAEVSRPVEKIVAEVERLTEAGVREVTLIGQNVNAYHGVGADGRPSTLGQLLRRLAQVPGILRLRYTTSHPRDMDDDLIAAHAELPALMPYVHLPVQSGSDRILAAMNRKHTRARLSRRDCTAACGRARSRLHLRLHRGLPGRDGSGFSRDPFARSMKSASPAHSPSCIRRGPEHRRPTWTTRCRRRRKPNGCNGCRPSSRATSANSMPALPAATIDVLLEKPGRLPGQLVGRSPYLQAVQVMAPANLIGSVKRVTVTEVGSNSLFAHARRRKRARRPLPQQELEAALRTTDSVIPPAAASEETATTQIVLAFEDNKLASVLFGQYGQNLALIERRLGVVAEQRGNHVTIEGSRGACEQARRVLEGLYEQLKRGHDLSQGDVEGAIRQAIAQGSLFDYDPAAPRPTFEEINLRKRPVRARTAAQDAYIRALKRHALVFGTGPAGTGKTWLAVAQAVQMFERKEVDRIILSRPAVEAGERLGFLPGDMREKVDPYLRPIYDALYDLMDARIVERALQAGEIEIAPLAFMRGRTLSNAAVILDEAQNTTSMQMKMFLTRLGREQPHDRHRRSQPGRPAARPDLRTGGSGEACSHGIEGVGHVAFTHEDVIRHELVARIVEAYDRGTPAREGKG